MASPPVAEEYESIFEGLLQKKNSKGKKGLRPWRTRYFVLTANMLKYYKTKEKYDSNPRKPRGFFERGLIIAVEIPKNGMNDFRFNITYQCPNSKIVIEMQAQNSADRLSWMRELSILGMTVREARQAIHMVPSLQREVGGLQAARRQLELKLVDAERIAEDWADKYSKLQPKVGELNLRMSLLQRKNDTMEMEMRQLQQSMDELQRENGKLHAEQRHRAQAILRAHEEVSRLEQEKIIKLQIQEDAAQQFAMLKPLLGCEFAETTGLKGTLITSVKEGLPAALCGLQENDLVLEVAHKPVKDKTDFVTHIGGYNPGDVVPLLIKRGKTRQTVLVELGSPALSRQEIKELRRKAGGGVTEEDVRAYIASNR